MAWYSVYLLETGRLYSVGSSVANPLPPEYGVVETEEEPRVADWDPILPGYRQ